MDREKPRIFLFGAGGHAKVITDAVEKQASADLICFCDDNNNLWGRNFYNYPVIGGRSELLSKYEELTLDGGIVALGNNKIRKEVSLWFKSHSISLITVIHPSAQISRRVKMNAGTVVFAGAVINVDTCIGEGVIINTGATVDHDCQIGNFVHISPGANLCGNVSIGDGSFIGAGSTVIPGVTIGKNVIVGAGSTVINDLEDIMKVAGSPARSLKVKNAGG